jgi:hypothetical protein
MEQTIMPEVKGNKSFQEALSGLTVSQQRQLGARFVANVLDLTDEPILKQARETAANPQATAEELVDSFHAVHAIYTRTHPRSDLSELNYAKQAVHFVAEACLLCLSPTYPEASVHRIAEKAAMYCRMARTCASIKHDEDVPQLGETERAMRQEIETQYGIVNEFLKEQ